MTECPWIARIAGVYNTFANASLSLNIKPPVHVASKPSPTMELCARWAVPNASLQQMSAKPFRDARNLTTASDLSAFRPCTILFGALALLNVEAQVLEKNDAAQREGQRKPAPPPSRR